MLKPFLPACGVLGWKDWVLDPFRPIDFASPIKRQVKMRGTKLCEYILRRTYAVMARVKARRAHSHLPGANVIALAKLRINSRAAEKAAISWRFGHDRQCLLRY